MNTRITKLLGIEDAHHPGCHGAHRRRQLGRRRQRRRRPGHHRPAAARRWNGWSSRLRLPARSPTSPSAPTSCSWTPTPPSLPRLLVDMKIDVVDHRRRQPRQLYGHVERGRDQGRPRRRHHRARQAHGAPGRRCRRCRGHRKRRACGRAYHHGPGPCRVRHRVHPRHRRRRHRRWARRGGRVRAGRRGRADGHALPHR